MKPLPAHLVDMTQAKWDSLSRTQRDQLRDTSELHPVLANNVGRKVRVSPPRKHGASTFRVGVSTGWRPILLAMQGREDGSSDVINPDEVFDHVDHL